MSLVGRAGAPLPLNLHGAVEWCVGFVESLPLDALPNKRGGELAEWMIEVEL